MSQDVINVSDTAEDVYRQMAVQFIKYTNRIIEETGSAAVAITGGTVVEGFVAALVSDEFTESVNWEHIHFLWTDERFVNHDDPDSYFGRIRDLLGHGNVSSLHFYGVKTCIGSVMNAAAGYEREVDTVLRGLDKEALDLAILDIGQDGHVAGLFPKSSVLLDETHKVVPVKDGKVWDRISMTFSFLAQAKAVWFGVVGESKRAALKKVLFQREDCQGMPWQERAVCALPGAVLCQERIEWFVEACTYQS